MINNTYKCAKCAGIFEKEWSDEEASAEYERDFGKNPGDTDCLVCDDCYKLLTTPSPLMDLMKHIAPISEPIPCKKCGGEGQLVWRPNLHVVDGDAYTVDCEDCDNSTNDEHALQEAAIVQWNLENTVLTAPPSSTPMPSSAEASPASPSEPASGAP